MTIKELLKRSLTKGELEFVPSSFDIIGNREKAVAIIELDDKIKKKTRMIADAIMKKHKNVKSVLLKASPRKGEFRTREYKIIAGSKNTEVIHIENGCKFMLDPMHVYFSPREGTERMRIVEKIKPDEIVLVMFAGVGPFAIEIAKKSKAKVIGIEINPVAVDYFMKNIKLNKLENVAVLLGDVADQTKDLYGKCDRVVMPLPEKSIMYLEEALSCLKPNGVCHFYCFAEENQLIPWQRRIKMFSDSIGKKIRFLDAVKVLPYGPRKWKYRIDFQVLK